MKESILEIAIEQAKKELKEHDIKQQILDNIYELAKEGCDSYITCKFLNHYYVLKDFFEKLGFKVSIIKEGISAKQGCQRSVIFRISWIDI